LDDKKIQAYILDQFEKQKPFSKITNLKSALSFHFRLFNIQPFLSSSTFMMIKGYKKQHKKTNTQPFATPEFIKHIIQSLNTLNTTQLQIHIAIITAYFQCLRTKETTNLTWFDFIEGF